MRQRHRDYASTWRWQVWILSLLRLEMHAQNAVAIALPGREQAEYQQINMSGRTLPGDEKLDTVAVEPGPVQSSVSTTTHLLRPPVGDPDPHADPSKCGPGGLEKAPFKPRSRTAKTHGRAPWPYTSESHHHLLLRASLFPCEQIASIVWVFGHIKGQIRVARPQVCQFVFLGRSEAP